jgi:type IV secretory pathway TrbD component
MLVQAQPGRQPIIQLASDHPGLRLVFQGPRPLLFGVDQNIATLTGLLAGIIIIAAISATPLGRGAAMAVGFGVGCVTAAVGAFLVRAFRWFRRLLG